MMKVAPFKFTLLAVGIAVLSFCAPPGKARAEVNQPFNVKALVPGMTESIDIGQLSAFPLGCPTFFVFTAGEGILGISLKKDDAAGDTIFMVGVVSSSSGTVPFYKVSQSKGMVDQIAEVGQQGFAVIYCGVFYSASAPKYLYQLRLSLAP